MIHHHSREEEPCRKHTILWPRKPCTLEERITAWVGSSDLHELLTAMEALERLGPGADSLLQSLVRHDAHKYRTGQKHLWFGATLFVLVSFTILHWSVTSPTVAANAALFFLIVVWLFAPFILSWYGDHRTYSRRLVNTTALLNRGSRPVAAAERRGASVGTSTQIPTSEELNPVPRLPGFSESGRVRLSTRHRVSLRRALRGDNYELILAILQISDRLLDTTFIPEVQRLTKYPDGLEGSAKIQTAARRSLSALNADAKRLCPDILEENRSGLGGFCALSSPPCPADAAQYPRFP